MIQLKRVYDPAASVDGERFLVERLWPRGIKKSGLRVDAWLKDVGPSTALRQWFGHDPKRWDEFRRRYFQELEKNIEACKPIERAAARGRVTLVYSSHDEEHNNAVALKELLEGMRKPPSSSGPTRAAAAPARAACRRPAGDHLHRRGNRRVLVVLGIGRRVEEPAHPLRGDPRPAW